MSDPGARFAELHQSGMFVMANVADAASARAVAEAGVDAIATSSAAHAVMIGHEDAAGDVSMDEHAKHTGALVAAVDLPCNVDGENGYGHEPEAMAAAVQRFATAGAAGMGIEDWSGDPEIGFYDAALSIARIEAAVEAARMLDRPFVITGRTDLVMYGDDRGLTEAITRLKGMAEVGAGCVYAPALPSMEAIRAVVGETGAPVNVLRPVSPPGWWPAGVAIPSLDDLRDAGVRRLSLGGSLFFQQAAHAGTIMRDYLS